MLAVSASRFMVRMLCASTCSVASLLVESRSPEPLTSVETPCSSVWLPRCLFSGRSLLRSQMAGSRSALPAQQDARRTAVSRNGSASSLHETSAGCYCLSYCSFCWTCGTSYSCGSSLQLPVDLVSEHCYPFLCHHLSLSCRHETASASHQSSLAKTWWSTVPSQKRPPGLRA